MLALKTTPSKIPFDRLVAGIGTYALLPGSQTIAWLDEVSTFGDQDLVAFNTDMAWIPPAHRTMKDRLPLGLQNIEVYGLNTHLGIQTSKLIV